MLYKLLSAFPGKRVPIAMLMVLMCGLQHYNAYSQCIRIKDPRASNRLTLTPRKNFACLRNGAPADQTVFRVELERAASNLTVFWGDVPTAQVIAGPSTSITHTYPDTGIFIYRIVQPGCADTIKGYFINTYNNSSPGIGFVFPPAGKENRRCLPATLDVRNVSPGMTGLTEFIVDWGGTEKKDTIDFRSYNQSIPHTYVKGSKICRARIFVTYNNICGLPPGTNGLTQSAGDYYYTEKDTALNEPSKITLCGPENVIINDASKLNCRDTTGRKIAWKAISGFAGTLPNPGDGLYRTYNTAANKRLTIPASALLPIPADSTYKLNMMLRNACGTDTTPVIIIVAQPRQPVLALLANNLCPGEVAQFTNSTVNPYPAGVATFEWDFGDGSPILVSAAPTVEHIYQIGGTYRAILSCVVRSTVSTNVCRRSSTVNVVVRRTVTPIIAVTPPVLCNSGVVRIQNKSVNTLNAIFGGWELDNQPLFSAGSGVAPVLQAGQDTSIIAIRRTNLADSSAIVAFKRHGRYVLSLKAQSIGCPQFVQRDTFDIYPTPTLRWKPSTLKACVGNPMNVRDSSVVFATDTNGLPRTFRSLRWRIDFGDSSVVSSSVPVTTNFDNVTLSNRLTLHTYRRPGTYTIRITVFSGVNRCPVTDMARIVVFPNPKPAFRAIRNRCENQKLTLKNLTTDSATYYQYEVKRGLLLYATYIRVDRADFEILVPYSPPGDSTFYQLTLKTFTITGADTCTNVSNPLRVGVSPTPVATFAVSPAADGCSPMTRIAFSNTSFNLPLDPGTIYTWRFGNGQQSNLIAPPLQDYVNPTTILLKDTATFTILRLDGCTYTASREILIFPSPNARIVSLDSVCAGVDVPLSATGNSLTTFLWSFPDFDQSVNTAQNPAKSFTNFTDSAKYYTIQIDVRSINNCPQTVTKRIKIFPQPQVQVALAPMPDKYCSPMPVRFSYQNVIGASRFQWFFSDTDSALFRTDTAFSRSFINESAVPEVRTIRMVASNGGRCSTTVQRSITINPEVRARMLINALESCHPMSLQASDSSSIGADRLTWFVGSQAFQNVRVLNQTILNQSDTRDSVVRVRLIVRNSAAGACRDTVDKILRIHPKPIVSSINIPSLTTCSPYLADLRAIASGASRYVWDYGDGTIDRDTATRKSHLFENFNPTADRSYIISLTGLNRYGCSDTALRTINVKPFTSAGIALIDSQGCSPYTVRISSSASVNANAFDWTFGTQVSSSQASPIVTLTNPSDTVQFIPVTLIARKSQVAGCPDTARRIIKVYPRPQADFSLSTRVGCGPLRVVARDSSRLGARMFWIISSGGVSDTINGRPTLDTAFSNPNPVNKSIQIERVVVSGQGCEIRKVDYVTVYQDVIARFEVIEEGCSPLRISIRNRSSNIGGTWQWNFGDGNRSTVKDPIHVLSYGRPGDTTYVIKLLATAAVGGCAKRDSMPVIVHGKPLAAYTITSSRRIQLPANTITLRNETPYAEGWRFKWLFGDRFNDTSRNRNIVHRYDFTNEDFLDTNFVVTQIVYNDYGCSDTLRQNIVIQPEAPKPLFVYADSVGCSPLSIAFYNRSTYGRSYLWEFGDKGISDEKNPVHVYSKSGKYTVKLTVYGFGGVRQLVRDTIIYVRPFPSALFTTIPSPAPDIVLPDSARFRVLTPCYDCLYEWTFGDGSTSNAINPVHQYKTTGLWDVSLTVRSPDGCGSTDTVPRLVQTVDRNFLQCPNAFVPDRNGPSGGYTTASDWRNTVFYPVMQGAIKINLVIYNRWGNLVYRSQEINKGWDGYDGGAMAPAGTYVYRVEVEFNSGEKQTKMGDITLLR